MGAGALSLLRPKAELEMKPMRRLAVIGGGVAGITAAELLQEKFEVTLYEAQNYLGGHTHTVVIPDGPDAGTPVDTGFIVLNDQTYPTLHRMLKRWEVEVRWSDMSFGFFSEETHLAYAGTTLNGLFCPARECMETFLLAFFAEHSHIQCKGGSSSRESKEFGFAYAG